MPSEKEAPQDIGRLLKQARLTSVLTQEQAADLAGGAVRASTRTDPTLAASRRLRKS